MHADVDHGIRNVLSPEDLELNVILVHIEFFMATQVQFCVQVYSWMPSRRDCTYVSVMEQSGTGVTWKLMYSIQSCDSI
jgi:hypothetical protein